MGFPLSSVSWGLGQPYVAAWTTSTGTLQVSVDDELPRDERQPVRSGVGPNIRTATICAAGRSTYYISVRSFEVFVWHFFVVWHLLVECATGKNVRLRKGNIGFVGTMVLGGVVVCCGLNRALSLEGNLGTCQARVWEQVALAPLQRVRVFV